MTDTLKVLGQVAPSAASLTSLYKVPSATQAAVSTIVVCNQSATPTTFRIGVYVNGGDTALDNAKQYTHYDVPIDGNDTQTITIGGTLGANDNIWVYATLATLSFTAFGVQVT